MIIRIVKMTFLPEKTQEFVDIFNSSQNKILQFEGSLHLELLNDIHNPNIFFTYSHWESEEALDKYRHSEYFAGVWKRTKPLFAAKTEAWSVIKKG